jgi:hypothetical protein
MKEIERFKPVERPEIRITLKDLLEAQPALQRLAAERLPVRLAYNVARMLKALQPDIDEFVKQRNELVKKYGATRPATEAEKPTHGPEVTEVIAANFLEFKRELDELTTVEIVVDRAPLALDDVEKISAADLLALGPLVKDAE